jgi:hypothetical protein
MFLRTVKVKQKGGTAEFVQLVQNERSPKTGLSQAKVLYHFGRRELLDLPALRRLVKSIGRFLGPEEAAAMAELSVPLPLFTFLGSRQLGGSWLLDGLWKRLQIDRTLNKILQRRGFSTPIERLIFGMVADRALAPSSKLAMEHWVSQEVSIPGLPEVEVHQLYRAMDFLLEASEELQREVFFTVANLLNLEVDLIFLDTTTTYFEIEGEDADRDGQDGLRKRGYSKDHRPDQAQVVIAFAVTRSGIPVRCWVWPGNTCDQTLLAEVKHDLNGWQLGRVVTVADTGFNSEANRRLLQTAGGHYILGEKLHQGPKGAPVEVLGHRGKFRKLDNDLEIKEVIVGADSPVRRRFVIVRNPEETRRDKAKRDDIVAETERRLSALRQLDEPHQQKAVCELRSHPVFGRYITQTPKGYLTINRQKIAAEAHLDGKFIVSSSDDRLSDEDMVMGYKQLWVVERVWRDLKHSVDIRPVYHRLEARIRAHVLLCWLALLLIRVAENETRQTWRQMRRTLQTLQLGLHELPAGQVQASSRLTPEQKDVYTILKVAPPPRYFDLPHPRRADLPVKDNVTNGQSKNPRH